MPSLPTPGVTTSWGDDLNAAIESLHLTGTHAARPTTGLVTGTLYSCSDHGLAYRWNGTTWVTWGGGAIPAVGVRVTKTADQSIPDQTWTELSFDAEGFDTHGFHDNATNNARLTVPADMGGLYQISGYVLWANTGSAGRRWAKLVRNGSASSLVEANVYAPAPDYLSSAPVTAAYLVPGDYVTMHGYQTSGGGALNALGGTVSSVLSMYRVGA